MKLNLVVFVITMIGIAHASQYVYLTVAYCPTYFTGAGSVVKVNVDDPTDYSIESSWKWPDLFGCIADYDPTVTTDIDAQQLFLDFTSDFGFVTTVDLKKGTVIHHVKPTEEFFVGYTNMAYGEKQRKLIGAQPTGKKDGEFQWAKLDPTNGDTKLESFIEFKAMMDDSHVYHPASDKYFVQCSYDQRAGAHCAPLDTDLCLLTLNTDTGALESALWTNWTAYKFGNLNDEAEAIGFLEDYQQCPGPDNHFFFAHVELKNAKATPIACMQQNITLQEEEWLSDFNADDSKLVTASRFEGNTQFLVLDTKTGVALQNSHLDGLAEKLGGVDKLFWVWDVSF